MNIVALSNRLASKVPHWHELEKLSKEDKIEVIALLSMSMANAEDIKTPADRTKEMVERCCGSWVGEQSAEKTLSTQEGLMVLLLKTGWKNKKYIIDSVNT